MKRSALLLVLVFAISRDVAAQKKTAASPSATRQQGAQARVSLSPRFLPGQTFHYQMVFETTTATSRSGMATDPQGPSRLVVTWNAAIRLDVLPAAPNEPGGMRLHIVYEKSSADVRSDTFDPGAAAIQDQYQKLEGKVLEFSLDAGGKVVSVSGLEGIVDSATALQSAREWIAQLATGSGAPSGGVSVGQKWSSDQAAASLPVSGMVWRTESEYLRNEDCRPANPNGPAIPSGGAPGNPEAAETCAVILTHLNLIRPKPVRDPTPEEFRNNGLRTAGKWNGSGQSLSYISLSTGLVVSVSQTGTEEMDVTLTTAHLDSLRYSGTILSRTQVALLAP
jgi:hypothetical protein